jgi:signal transduction histidine kinase
LAFGFDVDNAKVRGWYEYRAPVYALDSERGEWLREIAGDMVLAAGEVAGNLLDNACKWADAEVRLSIDETPHSYWLAVEDDGPGIPEAQRDQVLSRGARLDEQIDGHGLGLGIVRDIAEVWGGVLRLQDSPLGGLKVLVELPKRHA